MNGFPPSALETSAPGDVTGYTGLQPDRLQICIRSGVAAIRANTGPYSEDAAFVMSKKNYYKFQVIIAMTSHQECRHAMAAQ